MTCSLYVSICLRVYQSAQESACVCLLVYLCLPSRFKGKHRPPDHIFASCSASPGKVLHPADIGGQKLKSPRASHVSPKLLPVLGRTITQRSITKKKKTSVHTKREPGAGVESTRKRNSSMHTGLR